MAEAAATVSQLAAALRYAALGWQVIPLHTPVANGCSCLRPTCDRSAGKHPRFGDWVKRATTDADAIKGWWRTWSTANVGLVTGARSGFFVLDIDPEHGGEVSLAALLAEHGALPATVEALTGSGGRHILFRYPGQHVPNSTSKLGPGLDVRGDGGQIVAAPSLHRAGGTYEWQPGCEPGTVLADAPAWLLALLLEQPKPAAPAAPVPRSQPVDQAYRRAAAYLARIPGAVSGEQGHQTTWKAALAVVRGFRLSEGEAFDLLWSEYNPRCSPPWNDKELRHKVQDAIANGTAPLGYLLDVERPQQRPSAPPRAATSETPTPTSREPGSDDGEEPRQEPQAEAVPKPSRLGLRPVSELLCEKLPETEWLISPYLETASIAAIVAPPNLGKTLLAFYFATMAAAAGRRVAIIEEEGGKRGFQKRLDRAVRAVGSERCKGIDYSFKPRISLLSHQDIRQLCAELAGYDLVIIDSLARVTTGLEENDAKEMGVLVDNLDQIREATRACLLTIHHSGKTKWKPGEVPTLADGRGSSAFAGGIDTALGLAHVREEEKQPGVVSFTIHITKQRDEDNQVAPKLVRITMTGPEALVVFEEVESSKRPPSPAEQRVADMLHLVLISIPEHPSAPISREDLQEKIGRRAADVRAAVAQLIDKGKVKELSRRRLIRVPSAGPNRAGERTE